MRGRSSSTAGSVDDGGATPSVRVVDGDARTLAEVASESIHLIVTSPPYPMVAQWDALFAAQGVTDFEEMHDLLEEAWGACQRVLVPGGILVVNIGDALRSKGPGTFRLWPNHAEVLRRAERVGFRPLPYLLWKKPMNRPNAFLGSGFLPPSAYVTLDCEFLLIFRKGPVRVFPARDATRAASRFGRAERDAWFSQIWTIRGMPQSDAEGRRTARFPSEIPRRLIRMFSVVGDTVLDPFAGTGTTLRVARELGRNAVGVEIDPERARALAREFTP